MCVCECVCVCVCACACRVIVCVFLQTNAISSKLVNALIFKVSALGYIKPRCSKSSSTNLLLFINSSRQSGQLLSLDQTKFLIKCLSLAASNHFAPD